MLYLNNNTHCVSITMIACGQYNGFLGLQDNENIVFERSYKYILGKTSSSTNVLIWKWHTYIILICAKMNISKTVLSRQCHFLLHSTSIQHCKISESVLDLQQWVYSDHFRGNRDETSIRRRLSFSLLTYFAQPKSETCY